MVRLLTEHRAGLIEFGLLLRQVSLTDLALSAKTFHIGGPNSANNGQNLLVYSTNYGSSQ